MTSETAPRLTELAHLAGCAAKAGADSLQETLEQLADRFGRNGDTPAALLLGIEAPDDAAVYQVSEDQAIVTTIDYFAPIVDDPYCYGAIAAANAMSDVYAMGGEVALALNIAAFPIDMDRATVARVLAGGADKVAEAGGVIAGGHTIIDPEPKYGLSVIGFVHPQRIRTKGGAEPGQAVYLTKPIGTGLICTAMKFEEEAAAHAEAAVRSMTQLNRAAAALLRDERIGALTDVTGFGLVGHAQEIARASGVELGLEAAAIPLLPGAAEYAYRGVVTGGAMRNRQHFEERVLISAAVSEDSKQLLFDPQTSGGLLFTADPDVAARIEERFAEAELPLWRVGETDDGHRVRVTP